MNWSLPGRADDYLLPVRPSAPLCAVADRWAPRATAARTTMLIVRRRPWSPVRLSIPYPPDLYSRRIEGEVMLYLVVDSTGTGRARFDPNRQVERPGGLRRRRARGRAAAALRAGAPRRRRRSRRRSRCRSASPCPIPSRTPGTTSDAAAPSPVRLGPRHHRLDAADPARPDRRAASARRSTARRSTPIPAARSRTGSDSRSSRARSGRASSSPAA